MRSVRGRITRLLWLPVLGAAGWLLMTSLPHRRLLQERAAFIVKDGIDRYCWLSNRELLCIHEIDSGRFRIFKIDTVSKVKTEMTGLEAAMRFYLDFEVYLSPDGQWLLCPPFDGEPDATAVTLDGKRTLQWPVGGNTTLAWIPGTTRWMDIRNAETEQGSNSYLGRIIVHDVARPNETETLTTTAPVSNDTVMPVVTSDKHLIAPAPVMDSDDKCIVKLVITDCALEANSVTPKRNLLFCPSSLALRDSLVLSPGGERAAWVCHKEYIPSLQAWLHRWFSRFPIKPQHITALYVARLDGKETHKIAEADHYLSIDNLQWSPDGKQLSFLYQNALWVVPAN